MALRTYGRIDPSNTEVITVPWAYIIDWVSPKLQELTEKYNILLEHRTNEIKNGRSFKLNDRFDSDDFFSLKNNDGSFSDMLKIPRKDLKSHLFNIFEYPLPKIISRSY